MRKLLVAAALTTSAFLSAGVVAANAADSTVTVTPANFASGGHWFTSDTRSPGTGAFEYGPATPPIGPGSFTLSTPDGGSKAQLFTDAYNGTRLADITGIGYSTYQKTTFTPPAVQLAAMNMRVALDGGPTPNAYMTYEPYMDVGNNAILNTTWQNWDAYRGGTAKWWINTGAGGCGQSNAATNCTWARILELFPNATIREGASCGPGAAPVTPCAGSFGLNQGSGNPGASSNADALYVAVSGNKTTYNLEPAADTTKPSCGSMVVRRNAPSGKDEADVTITDSGSGIANITNFTVNNGTASVPAFTPGASSVTVTAIKGTQGQSTFFEFDVTDRAGNTIHCV